MQVAVKAAATVDRWELTQAVRAMVSVPDRLANALRGITDDRLEPNAHAAELAAQALATLPTKADADLPAQLLVAVSEVLERLCVVGRHAVVVARLVTGPRAPRAASTAAILASFTGVALERVAETLLVRHTAGSRVERAQALTTLAKGAQTSSEVRYLLTTKFALTRSYPESFVAEALAALIAQIDSTGASVMNVLLDLLELWGDASVMHAVTPTAHFYRTLLVVALTARLPDSVRCKRSSELLRKLMAAVEAHVGCPVSETRLLGFAAAEVLTGALQPIEGGGDAISSLTFDYTPTQQTDAVKATWSRGVLPLENLLPELASSANLDTFSLGEYDKEVNAVTDVGIPFEQDDYDGDDPDEPFFGGMEIGLRPTEGNGIDSDDNAESDSDDNSGDEELQPYAMPDDSINPSSKAAPKYLRECLKNLRTREDPELLKVSLPAAARLIRANPADLAEVAVDFASTLLHLDNEFAFDHFAQEKHDAMVALMTQCPAQVGEYLASQFYERNYSVSHRLEILKVLRESSQELARISPASSSAELRMPAAALRSITDVGADDATARREAAEAVIRKRLEAKTRRFCAPRRTTVAEERANVFASFVGAYFYPLLNGADAPREFLDLRDRDSLVLASLIQTLGDVLAAAGVSPATPRMGGVLLDYLLTLRNHRESHVRRSVAFALTMIFRVTPQFALSEFYEPEVREARLWLQLVFSADPDPMCAQLAGAVSIMLH